MINFQERSEPNGPEWTLNEFEKSIVESLKNNGFENNADYLEYVKSKELRWI